MADSHVSQEKEVPSIQDDDRKIRDEGIELQHSRTEKNFTTN